MKYRTFLRSCKNWSEFANAAKVPFDSDLTLEQAREQCEAFNKSRNEEHIEAGTKMEFESE